MDIVLLEIIKAKGHKNVKAEHKTTFEITKDNYLTERGDCIIGISSSTAAGELKRETKDYIKSGKKIAILLLSNGYYDIVRCWGNPELELTNSKKIIIRKSRYVDNATLCINADKSAADLNRDLIRKLSEENELTVVLIGFSELNF